MKESTALKESPPEVTPLYPTQQRDYKKIVLYSGIGLAVFIAALLSYFWFVYATTHISTDNAYVDADLYTINCRIMGYVKEVLAKDNELVKKGQVLAVLDDTDFGVELGYKKAKFTKAKNDFERIKQGMWAKRCEWLERNPPEGWRGVWEWKQK